MISRLQKNFKNLGSAGCALAILCMPVAATAQTTPAPTPPSPTAPIPPASQPQVDAAEFQQAIRLLSIFNAAFSNPNVNEVTKAKLFDCMFFNSLQQLNAGVQKTFADNPELSFDNNVHLFRIATAICGVTTEELSQPAANPPATVEPQTQAPGR